MKKQDLFLIGCLLSSLSFLYLENTKFEAVPMVDVSMEAARVRGIMQESAKKGNIEKLDPTQKASKVANKEEATSF